MKNDTFQAIGKKYRAWKQSQPSGQKKNDIAIIGMACRFPGAANYEEFWENLKQGRSSIQEIPQERWNWRDYWGDPKTETNKINCKWGGFIDNFDTFDPEFFSLSAREVETMDPQQRIMLELSWSCFEDAGICPSHLSGQKIGVFIGTAILDYKELQERKFQPIETHYATGIAHSVIPSRISFYYNFKGPSFPLDAACASSLFAIHSAIQSISLGECSMALVGGVNLLLTPPRYISFAKMGLLSPTGSCKTFDDSADGIVRGEGAGLILLKPLEKAQEDGDPIYAILKGSAINHSGKTHTLTYPNPEAQAEVIYEAYKRAGITPDTVSYVETHGTGTPKGDPMEFQGLLRAFQGISTQGTQKSRRSYCGLSSVKTNIGHLESAAGIAGVIKVLLALKHKQIPGLQNFKQLNHRISIENSPFFMVDHLQEWTPLKGETNHPIPRRAGVSSFGFAGTNAHVVLEEAPPIQRRVGKKHNYYLICLSAKTEEALRQKERDLARWLEKKGRRENDITDISATLLLGREHFTKRVAYVVLDIQDLQRKLKDTQEKSHVEGCFRGRFPDRRKGLQPFFEETGHKIVNELSISKNISEQEYGKRLMVLGELFVNGYNLDWKAIFGDCKINHINLPTYPFAKEHYWIPETLNGESNITIGQIVGSSTFAKALHPLVHENTSNLSEQRFSSTFTGREFFLADHVVKGQRVLPGVAYLEMAQAAVLSSLDASTAQALKDKQACIRLKNVVWSRPIVVDRLPVRVHISIFPEANGEIVYEIYSEGEESGTELAVHSQGSAVLSPVTELTPLDLSLLKAQCNQWIISSNQCYDTFKEIGLQYGPGHQGIEEVFTGNGQALAKLSLPSSVLDTLNQFVLHPSLVDSALQASIGLIMGFNGMLSSDTPIGRKLILPFALEELEIIGKCASTMWAVIRFSKSSSGGAVNKGREMKAGDRLHKLDIDLCDDVGNICIRMKGFSSRGMEEEPDSIKPSSGVDSSVPGKLMLNHFWKEQAIIHAPVRSEVGTLAYTQHLVMFCEPGNIFAEKININLNGMERPTRSIILQSDWQNIEERFQIYAAQILEEIQNILNEKPKDKVLVQLVVFTKSEQQLFTGLSGLLKTAHLENPKFIGQLIEYESYETPERIIANLLENSQSPMDNRIRYQAGKRWIAAWNEVEVTKEEAGIPWKDRGIYLITGGMGGLGLLFSREIALKVKDATLILTGRSPLDENKQALLKEIENLGARVLYKQIDVTQKKAVEDLIKSIRQESGSLHGIIHSAGIIRDNFIVKKTREELLEVLAPKVAGLANLDQASRDLPLDFFILFSSIAGALGNTGQADYSTANAFMDAYAEYRDFLVRSKQCHGRTLSINWPLWKEGGMHISPELAAMMAENMGMVAMQTATGIRTLYESLASPYERVMVIEGDLALMKQKLLPMIEFTIQRTASSLPTYNPDGLKNEGQAENKKVPVVEDDLLREKAIYYFKKLLSSVIKMPVDRIEAEASLDKYGIDSIMVMQLTNQMQKTFGSLPKTLFFEYQNIRELTGYFLDSYHDQMLNILGVVHEAGATFEDSKDSAKPYTRTDNTEPVKLEATSHRQFVNKRFATFWDEFPEKKGKPLDIAIIGVSGRYPGAKNIQEFWKNLRDGKDCIVEIPKDRWDHSLYFDEDKNKPGKTYSKWGGFLDGVDQFDPLFFNISPREAETMDPQERLFLECVNETLEDAGYTREALSLCLSMGLEGNVGVFVGVMYEEYQLYGAQEQIRGRTLALAGSPASIANRVSYFYNFHGPSMAVDTMCSSSLTAVHLACQSIQRGDCELAIAGGVNVSIHPNKYLMLGQGKFVSSKGRCESFGEGGDGYVPGEGVGAVLLKPLSKAIADEDQIYGVIKATAINHGGKTNGFTVPNPNAQAGVISRVFKEAGIDPRKISYIEAHGTGTSLGDPIEIAGLNKAFQEFTKDKQFCAIGSAKSNIGHCESASGIAGMTKILLQLKNNQLAPSLHSKILNPNIDFSNTPFVVQQTLTEWKRPVFEIDGNVREYPRIAGISAFGAGGSNAHLVIEEYIPEVQERPKVTITPQNPAIIVLSAKNEERLKEQAFKLLTLIQDKEFADLNLADVAYTLQKGREAMEERLALIAGSVNELGEKLRGFIEGREDIEDLFRGQIKHNKETVAFFASDEELQEAIDKWVQRRKYGKLLELWVKGLVFDWNKLYSNVKPRRISLPTYPFAKDRYWAIKNEVKSGNNQAINSANISLKVPDDGNQMTVINTVSVEDTGKSLIGNIMAIPVWDVTPLLRGTNFPYPSERVVIVGGTEENKNSIQHYYPKARVLEIQSQYSIDEIFKKLEECGPINHIFWIVSYHPLESLKAESLIEDQNSGVFLVFKMIKALLRLGYGAEELGWSVITSQIQPKHKNDTVNPTHMSIHGLIGAMAKEYPNWQIRLVDLDAYAPADKIWPIADILSLVPDPKGDPWVYRGGEWYRQKLIPYNCPPLNRSLYRTGGVYVVIGGAGGIGEAWSEYMIKTYQARIIWIGRRQKDTTIQDKLDKLAALGTAPLYIAADATNRKALQKAYDEIKQNYTEIHGVIQSAIVLLDQSLANMDEEKFRMGLAAKVDVSVRMAQIFHKEPLDFVMFFSSINSFLKMPGQSNYVAGCIFKDVFAHQLSNVWPCAVKVMNWGYWGSVGVATSKAHQDRMARSGHGSIELPDAMEAIEVLLAGPMDQVAFLKTTKPFAMKEISTEEWIEVDPENSDRVFRQRPQSQPVVMAGDANESCISKNATTVVSKNGAKSTKLPWEEIDKLLMVFKGEGGISESYGLYVLKAFQSMGFFESLNQKMEIKVLYEKLGHSDKQNKILNTLLHILETRELIEVKENLIFLSETGNSYETRNRLQKVASRLELLARTLPELLSYFSLLNYCIENYPALLQGKISNDDLFGAEPVLGWVRETLTLNGKWNDPFGKNIMLSIAEQLAIFNTKKKLVIVDLDWTWNPISRIVLDYVNKNRQEAEYFYIDGSPAFQEIIHKAFGDKELPSKSGLSHVDFHPLKDENEILVRISPKKADIIITQGIRSDTRKLEHQLNLTKELRDPNGIILAGIHPLLAEIFTLTFGLLEDRLLNHTEPDLSGQDLSWSSIFSKSGYRVETFGEWLTLAWQKAEKNASGFINEHQSAAITSISDVASFLMQSFSSILHIAEKDLDIEKDLQEYGIDSITTSQAYILLQKKYGKLLSPQDLIDNATIKQIADLIIRRHKKSTMIDESQTLKHAVIEPIAGFAQTSGKAPIDPETKLHRPSIGLLEAHKSNDESRKLSVQFDGESIQTDFFETSSNRKYEIVTSGEGPAIMFLTGLAFTWKVWRYQIRDLQKQYRLIFPHLPGHGTSDSQSREFTFDDLTEDLLEILNHYQIKAAHLVGWCMGGNIAQYFASRYPKKLKSLILVGTTPTDARVRGMNSDDLADYSVDPLATYVFEFRNCLKNNPLGDDLAEGFLEFLQDSCCRLNTLYVLNYINNLFQFDSIDKLKNINIPTLVIAGKWDIAFPTDQVGLLYQGIAGSKYVEFDQSGHLPFITQHDLFNNELLKFLAMKKKL